jgi:16S rRNA (cytidine1402-2'-O)-methyltransferase
MQQHLYLIPTSLAENTNDLVLPQIKDLLRELRYFLVENVRTARRFISGLKLGVVIDELYFFELNKDTTPAELQHFFSQIPPTADIGVMSEAGCPAVADPGSLAVAYAHQKNIKVVPLVGASSLLLSLMASGFNGQSFIFHGYLPIDKTEKQKALKQLEKDVVQKSQTQIFIETPYRNQQLLADLCQLLQPDTLLCVATNLTSPDEWIKTQKISAWKKTTVDLHKKPTVFLMGRVQ